MGATKGAKRETLYFAILDHFGDCFGYWQGNFHYVEIFASQKKARQYAIEKEVFGYKISIAKEAMRRKPSRYSKDMFSESST